MSIAQQFKGLDMKNLIGGPLSAAADASVMLANCTAEFINNVGFDAENKVRTAAFKYTRREPTDDGNALSLDMGIEIPLLAIVPIPNLQIDEVNITFDMEVKQSEKSESSASASAGTSVDHSSSSSKWRSKSETKVSITGSVATQSSNTRSTDNSAKYHVDVRATNHGTPEGLARVLDILAASVAPGILSSRPVDDSGNELTGTRRERSLKLKELREQRMQLENSERAAGDSRDLKLKALKQKLASLHSVARDSFTKENTDEKKSVESVNDYWNDLQANIGQRVATAVSSKKDIKAACPPLTGYDNYTKVEGAADEFNAAVAAQAEWESKQKAVDDKKIEYNNVMMGTSVPAKTA